jgi:hypothetical protein
MTNISSQSIWETLSTPLPAEFTVHANLNHQIENLERKNNTGMYIILGLGMLLVGVSIYLMIEDGRKKYQQIQ